MLFALWPPYVYSPVLVATENFLPLAMCLPLWALVRALDRRMDELIRITRQTQILEERIRYYRTPEGVGRLAREEFNLFLPWEKVYRIEVVSADPLRKR